MPLAQVCARVCGHHILDTVLCKVSTMFSRVLVTLLVGAHSLPNFLDVNVTSQGFMCIDEFQPCDPKTSLPWGKCCQPGGLIGELKCCNAGGSGPQSGWVCAARSGGICNPGRTNSAAVAEMVV